MSWETETEHTPEELKRRADHARRLLADPLLLEVIQAARTSYVEESLEGATVEVRERARAAALALGDDGELLRELRATSTGVEDTET